MDASVASATPRLVSGLPLPATPPKVAVANVVAASSSSGARKGEENTDGASTNLSRSQLPIKQEMERRREERELLWKRIQAAQTKGNDQPSAPIANSNPSERSTGTLVHDDDDGDRTAVHAPTSQRVDSVRSKLQRAHQRRKTLDKLRAIRTRLESWKGQIPTATAMFASTSPLRYRKVSPFQPRSTATRTAAFAGRSVPLTAETAILNPQAVAWLNSAEEYLQDLQQSEVHQQQSLATEKVAASSTEHRCRAIAASIVLSKKNCAQAQRLLDHIARLRNGSAGRSRARSSIPAGGSSGKDSDDDAAAAAPTGMTRPLPGSLPSGSPLPASSTNHATPLKGPTGRLRAQAAASSIASSNNDQSQLVLREGTSPVRPPRSMDIVFPATATDAGMPTSDASSSRTPTKHKACLLYTSPSPRDRG